jgi:menaquinol-cytochrome c reductase iron-sulfur subunit
MKPSKKTKSDEVVKSRVETLRTPPGRRTFLVRATAIVVGGFVALFPALAGLVMFLDPLRRKSQAGQFLKVADLDEIPADGVPRSFPIIADRTDAWNFYPQEPVGACYLRITDTEEGQSLEAVSAICPHLGCFVDFQTSKGIFKCPCHDSSFEPSGTRINPEKCPAPRDLDALDVEIRNESEVWVKFQKFIGGEAEKIPEA